MCAAVLMMKWCQSIRSRWHGKANEKVGPTGDCNRSRKLGESVGRRAKCENLIGSDFIPLTMLLLNISITSLLVDRFNIHLKNCDNNFNEEIGFQILPLFYWGALFAAVGFEIMALSCFWWRHHVQRTRFSREFIYTSFP